MPHYYDGWSGLWMIGLMAVLRKRLAAGEISQDEYEKTKRLLQG
jgi:hypothetical protein